MDDQDEKMNIDKMLNGDGKGGDESGSTDESFVNKSNEETDAHSIKSEDLKPKRQRPTEGDQFDNITKRAKAEAIKELGSYDGNYLIKTRGELAIKKMKYPDQEGHEDKIELEKRKDHSLTAEEPAPKKKRGWPKGKPRGPRKPKTQSLKQIVSTTQDEPVKKSRGWPKGKPRGPRKEMLARAQEKKREKLEKIEDSEDKKMYLEGLKLKNQQS